MESYPNLSKKVFNIRYSCPFWDTLAGIYLEKYANNPLNLANVLFLLPNRRACQMLTAAFVRKQGMRPTILPQMTPISEPNDDDLFFNGFEYENFFDDIRQPIHKEERLFLFTRLIMSKPGDFGLKQINLAQAYNLAGDLAKLIDEACNQGLSFDRLQDLVPEKYATHWQETLKLLQIITEYWPQILQEREAEDSCVLKNKLLQYQANVWQTKKTQQEIVAAGITASFPVLVNLLKSILNLPNGFIYFAGIDRFADADYWEAVDETHPLYENKKLLNLLDLLPADVVDIAPADFPEREQLISELMRPASISDKWRSISKDFPINKALEGIDFINCDSQRDEALVIALKMREVLEYPEKTAALITYDRNLARRVASELGRFGIKIDDSAGLPLNLSPVGIFLRLIAEAAENLDSETALITLLKHPFMLFSKSAATFRQIVYIYEKALREEREAYLSPSILDCITQIKDELTRFNQFLQSETYTFAEILIKHLKLAETFASSADETGDKLLWRGEAGRTAANFATKILESASSLGSIKGHDYLPLLAELMGNESIRATYGTHPRLSILGPIEARLCHFDYVILGEFNEGIWPKSANADMWMSRPMKKDFGFDLPEKAIGILAADLCCFLASPNVIITRAERVDGVPMKKSRWLLRLQTVLNAANSDISAISDSSLYKFSHSMEQPSASAPIKAPAPCPPTDKRPRKLSASGVDLLIHDPYAAYAKYILTLYPLNNLDRVLDKRDFGMLVHSIIEEFNTTYPNSLPENALDILLSIGRNHFDAEDLSEDIETFWWNNFVKIAEWIVLQEQPYRSEVTSVYNEVKGEISYTLSGGAFKFTAKADRIDVLKNGKINIIDYKTGKLPAKTAVLKRQAMQLPIEGLIAEKGSFEGVPRGEVENVIYWQLGKQDNIYPAKKDDFLEKSEEYLLKLIEKFDSSNMPYHPKPLPKFADKNRDYDHLARVKEWSVQEDGENNG